ncbi:MAG: hypothetical protein F6K18_29835 [Okeania sp. SIO2C2]|uniref:hypothetical protein n=1 Tax=Okeania sp. SIO2C2 TaxID=2607787 RepID=UPI0013B70896|nr:hypothetical protein [Okeania sp. SIO2C2]NEP90680.1 hypothetical protein [Okeania sp. SIO2C2]
MRGWLRRSLHFKKYLLISRKSRYSGKVSLEIFDYLYIEIFISSEKIEVAQTSNLERLKNVLTKRAIAPQRENIYLPRSRADIFWKSLPRNFRLSIYRRKIFISNKNWQKVERMVEAIAPLQKISTYL